MSLKRSIGRYLIALATILALPSLSIPGLAADLEANEAQAAGPDSPIPPRFIYAVTAAGTLLVYRDDSTDAAANWLAQAVATPPITGVNWANFAQVFAGGDGIIYAVDNAGSLHCFRLIDPYRNAVAMSWSADSNSIIGAPGFWTGIKAAGLSRMTFGRDGFGTASSSLVRAIWSACCNTGGTFWEHGWQAGGLVEPNFLNWTHADNGTPGAYYPPPLPGPTYPNVFEGGGGITYAIDATGNLLRFRIHPDGQWVNPDGTVVSAENAKPLQIGTGWSGFKFVTASPGEYLIEGYISTATQTPSGTVATLSVMPDTNMSRGSPFVVKVRASTFSPVYAVRLLQLHRDDDSATATPSGLIEGTAINGPFTAMAPAGGNFKKAENFTMHSTGAQWAGDIADIPVPSSAQPGIYAAELTTPSGGRYLAPFVVKPLPKSTPKNIAVIANVSTWNAYNQWGGSSRYFSWVNPGNENQPGQSPLDLSFERPFLETPPRDGAIPAIGLINRDPLAPNHETRAEVWITSWLSDLAAVNPKYAYDVFTDIDLDQGIPKLVKYKVMLIDTHPEYWSDNMRTNLEAYLNGGGHLVLIGGNGLYDRVTVTSAGNLHFQNGVGGYACGKQDSPIPCPGRDLFRYANTTYPNGRSERAVLGEAYETYVGFVDAAPFGLGNGYTVVDNMNPFLSSLSNGTQFGEAVFGLNNGQLAAGWEVDQYQPQCGDFPNGICTTSHSTLVGSPIASSTIGSDIVYRMIAGGGWVFAAGSITFGGVLAIDPTVQGIVKNALDYAIP
jgi:hypothetical protein